MPRCRCKGGVTNSDIVRSYLGLLVQGKSDFDAIENFRGDTFYKQALGIGLLPSSPTLRQRMDARACELFDFAAPMIETLLSGQRPDYGVLPCGWLPLDVDTFAMDNGGTAKEGVGRTYAGVDGYCPLAAYLGSHGFCLELALRPGVQHSASRDRLQPRARHPDGAAPERGRPEGADPGAAGLGLRLGALMRGIEACNRAGPAAGGLADQVEPAQHRRGRAGRTAGCRCRHALGAPARGQARDDLGAAGSRRGRRSAPCAACCG